MKLASIRTSMSDAVVAANLSVEGRDWLVDLTRAYRDRLNEEATNATNTALAEALLPTDMRLLLEGGAAALAAARDALAHAKAALASADVLADWRACGIVHKPETVTFLPPVPRPGKIISIGANYRKHLAEFKDEAGGAVLERVTSRLGEASFPPGFAKLPSTLTGHKQPIHYPRWTTQLDYEAELCVVIGRRCKNVAVADVPGVIAGYTIMNDVSMRDIQSDEMSRGMLLMGKNLDTTAPVGPWLVTADEVANPQALEIRCWVNGDLRQHASTAEMIFGVAEIIAHYSRMTLEPGDIFTTGSPAGVGITAARPERYLLKPGDEIEIEIQPLGRLINRVVVDPDS